MHIFLIKQDYDSIINMSEMIWDLVVVLKYFIYVFHHKK